MRISHEAIYAYVYVLPKGTLKKELIRSFRRSHKRRYPKRKDVSKIKAVTRYGRPRRVLNWETPHEAFTKIVALDY